MPTASRQSKIASSETAREINRDLLLHAIHRHQPVSRADLARLTGLQPSTVSVIVSQLIDERWVVAGAQGRLPRGRRPTFVMLNDRHVTLAIDLRPSTASLAVIDINGKLLGRRDVELPPQTRSRDEARQAFARVAAAARSLDPSAEDRMVGGIGISVSGRIDPRTRQLVFAPNVPWVVEDFRQELEEALGTPVQIENAANACLYGARWFGSLGDVSNLIVVTVSEGVGAGLLVDGRLLYGFNGMAGEFGHMPIAEDGPLCGCGNTGCWETFASNRAGLRYYKELVPDSDLNTFQQFLDLALAGDIHALRSIDRMANALARGLSILSAGLAPEVIQIVGDCTALWPRIAPLLESRLIANSYTSHTPRVVAAQEGSVARLRGAAALVFLRRLFRQGDFGSLAAPLPSQTAD
ncbi:MAG: ROK family transcriptional regulator [Terracidiphilus sp.]|nr:ROK family transcriptional regulator [Terracidiphilus sp.]